MAFTSAPEKQTHSSVRIPLAVDLEFAAGSHSVTTLYSGMNNLVAYKDGDEEYCETRNGYNIIQIDSNSFAKCRGSFVWEKTVGTAYFFLVTGDGTTTKVWTSPDFAVWTVVDSWADSAQTPVRFTEFITSSSTKSLVLVTGTRGMVYTSNAAGTQIVDADFPNPHVPFPVFMNGRLFLAKAATGDLYNSALDDPTSWTAGDFISSEVYPDDIQALVKINNYILAIGVYGSEYFYDAANATGSPLARYEGAVLPFGTLYPNSIASNKDEAVFLANRSDGGESVLMMIDGLNHKKIPAESFMKHITKVIGGSVPTTTPAAVRGYFIRHFGELLYAFNSSGVAPSDSITLVYSFTAKKFSLWTSGSSGTSPFPACFAMTGPSGFPFTYISGNMPSDGVWFGIMSSEINDDVVDGDGRSIFQQIVIPPQSFDTLNRKFMHRVGLMYNRYAAEVSGPNLSWSDDNMVTFSSSRTFDGHPNSADGGFPFLTQLGSFRSRGFKISTVGKRHCFKYLEVDINKGQQ